MTESRKGSKQKSQSRFEKECDSKRIESIYVYTPKLAAGTAKRNIRFYNIIFLVLYVYQVGWALTTIGEPYRKFLEKADREGFQVMEGATKMRAELEHSLGDINDPNRRTKKIGWTDWMDYDIEELAAEKKRDKERSVLDSLPKSMRVPSKYAASFWPTLLLGMLATLHALVLLMQHWSVSFNTWINYQEMDADKVQIPESMLQVDLEEMVEEDLHHDNSGGGSGNGDTKKKDPNACRVPDRVITNVPSSLPTHARISPAKGKDILLPLEYYPTLGMTFEYHRRRYVYQPEDGTWSKIRCRTDFSLPFLSSWTGFASVHQLLTGQIRYGPNMFAVKQPTFVDLYKKQLLNPFSVFQVFCVLLWAIDDYLIYSFFSLFMVLTFEGTVVFQRLKSLQALRGMGNPSRNIQVFRSNHWSAVDSSELLPGDIMSLNRVKPHHAKQQAVDAANASASAKKPSNKVEDEGGDVVPADLLLLRGSTVVNEASLTGESVPQMKEGLTELEEGETLGIKGKHKMNVVYAGTIMLQCKGATDYLNGDENGASSSAHHAGVMYSQIPAPPDNGCVCFVLRTGFASAQGKLVRMIEGSQEKVKGHEKETGLLLLFLCFFAVISSSYVLYRGMQDENRSKYELLLHCIMIVTSVIRPELPMQMAMAVNNSLMTLMKMHVFCTEPYRVPMAGKLDACLFDKTGTLTTDELVAVGVCEPNKLNTPKGKEDEDEHFMTYMMKVSNEAALVLAGCHSLVVYDEETTGDPLEKSAMNAMRWHISLASGNAVPAPATAKKPAGNNITLGSGHQISEVAILTRHHFSSKLQRMSCVIKAGGKKYATAKGSPEAIGTLLESKPKGYDEKAAYLSKQGYRVIALAFKPLESQDAAELAQDTRAACETNLIFAGFMVFTCMVRKDTAAVLTRLKEGGMTVAMVTGDALLTAIHVAKEVHICEPLEPTDLPDEAPETNEELQALLAAKRQQKGLKTKNDASNKHKTFKPVAYLDTTEKNVLYWCSYEDESYIEDYSASRLPQLSEQYDLATTGKCLALAFECDPDTTKVLQHIKVFARMTPDAKETVIECLHSIGSLCLMCGDGANDVGALKQADVGVALLTGFGNLNVETAEDEEDKKKAEKEKSTAPTAIMSQAHLDEIRALPVMLIKGKIRALGVDPDKYPDLVEKNDLVQLYQIKAREVAVKRHEKKNELDRSKMSKAELQVEKKTQMAEKQRKMALRAAELEAEGVPWATFVAMKEFYALEMQEAKQRKASMGSGRGVEASAATLAAQFEDMESGDQPLVKLGDASIAAPFTSKMPSIRSCVDIVRQGRCTLVSTIQMYQIMSLQCLISSYSLSVLYLDGVKYGDSQMTALGMLGTVSFMSVSRSKPLDKLSKVRPLTSIFHPALFLSLLGQFAIHLMTMYTSVQSAKKLDPEALVADLDGQFKPGMLNTVVFLVGGVQQVTVFFVNLQGRPFMTGVTENRPLLWSLAATFILTFMLASESVPGLNRYLQLVSFPDESFRDFILMLLGMNLFATFAWDRLMQFFFCRDILAASVEGTTIWDVFGILKTFGIIGVIMHVFLGNSDQWDEMLALENEALNATNATDVLDAISECVGEACEVINQTLHDEF